MVVVFRKVFLLIKQTANLKPKIKSKEDFAICSASDDSPSEISIIDVGTKQILKI